MRSAGPRVIGVYPKRSRWRVVYIDEAGDREEETCATKAEAEKWARLLRRRFAGPGSVAAALDEYEKHLMATQSALSASKTRKAIASILPGDADVDRLSAAKIEKWYRERAGEVSADTHQRALMYTRGFLRWARRRGWVKSKLAEQVADIKPIGRRKSGPESKPQLRLDEARRWLAQCLKRAEEGWDGGLAASLTLLCGLRAGEVRRLKARDVDDGGRLLWVDGTKTRSSRRYMEVPFVVRSLLVARAVAAESEFLFGERGINWVRNWVQRICRESGVPVVTAHSMRGLHASLAREAGSTGHAVAGQLGHSSEQMHIKAYADRNQVAVGDQRRVLVAIDGGRK